MKRGEIWTLAARGDYTGKPRPAVIVQDDNFSATGSVTVCPFTTDPTAAPLFRVEIAPAEENGLRSSSRMMVDKLVTVARGRLGERMGRLGDSDLVRLNRAITVFLGLAAPSRK